MKCERCEKEKELRDNEDECCDICQDCYDDIERTLSDQMGKARDAVGYLNGTGNSDPKLEMSAFLHIFHPEMPFSTRNELIREAK